MIAEGIILTVLAWVTHALRIILITMSLGYTLPLPDIFLILPLISALSIIPVTISGSWAGRGGIDGGYCRVWNSLIRCIVDRDTGPESYHALSLCRGGTGCGKKYSPVI